MKEIEYLPFYLTWNGYSEMVSIYYNRYYYDDALFDDTQATPSADSTPMAPDMACKAELRSEDPVTDSTNKRNV